MRHNAVTDIVLAKWGQLKPELESAGLLTEQGIMLELRRPADVLIEGPLTGDSLGFQERFALDVKVINVLGQCQADATCTDPLVIMEK